MTAPAIRILVVDDQQLVRAGLRQLLTYEDDLEIVGECTDGTEVVDAVDELAPDIVLMDIRMKEVDGVEATRRLQDLEGAPPVLVLTTFGEDEVVAAALRAGAHGFVLKDTPSEELARAIRRVVEGGAWLDPQVTAPVLEMLRETGLPRAAQAAKLVEITDREREVLTLIGRGRTNQEIAAELYITEATVKSHVSSILSKLGLRDRAAAVVLAFDHGLVQPGEAGTR